MMLSIPISTARGFCLPVVPLLILLQFLVMACGAGAASSPPPSRDVLSLTKWAQEQGIFMHKNLQWKQYSDSSNGEDDDDDDDSSSNWGLELKEAVKPGTLLMKVPRELVLDADRIYVELKKSYGDEKLQNCVQSLGDFVQHLEGFLIMIKLLKLRCSSNTPSRWTPWIQALPKSFPIFSEAEQECLPFYAKYAVQYQQKKLQAFCEAAKELGITEDEEDKMYWAFGAVGSRFWKTQPSDPEQAPTTELVPGGDMFNHREPPNVAVEHTKKGSVDFIYKGDADPNNKDLFITYGQPSNPHRFLAIFGFLPTTDDMPYVWSHVAYSNNPFSNDVPKMVFRTKDGMIPKIVWDAVLFALLEPSPDDGLPNYTSEQHAKYQKHTTNVLQTHVAKQLEELAALRERIETTEGDNMDLIRQHNEFLTTVFTRVKTYLESGQRQDLEEL